MANDTTGICADRAFVELSLDDRIAKGLQKTQKVVTGVGAALGAFGAILGVLLSPIGLVISGVARSAPLPGPPPQPGRRCEFARSFCTRFVCVGMWRARERGPRECVHCNCAIPRGRPSRRTSFCERPAAHWAVARFPRRWPTAFRSS